MVSRVQIEGYVMYFMKLPIEDKKKYNKKQPSFQWFFIRSLFIEKNKNCLLKIHLNCVIQTRNMLIKKVLYICWGLIICKCYSYFEYKYFGFNRFDRVSTPYSLPIDSFMLKHEF